MKWGSFQDTVTVDIQSINKAFMNSSWVPSIIQDTHLGGNWARYGRFCTSLGQFRVLRDSFLLPTLAKTLIVVLSGSTFYCSDCTEWFKDLLEEVFKVITTAGGPREVTGVPALYPLSWHDVGSAGAGWVVIVMVHPQVVAQLVSDGKGQIETIVFGKHTFPLSTAHTS